MLVGDRYVSPTEVPRMIFGLPLDAWILLFVAVGLGLGLELAFYRARRHDRSGGA